jgi:hypothetical protein
MLLANTLVKTLALLGLLAAADAAQDAAAHPAALVEDAASASHRRELGFFSALMTSGRYVWCGVWCFLCVEGRRLLSFWFF